MVHEKFSKVSLYGRQPHIFVGGAGHSPDLLSDPLSQGTLGHPGSEEFYKSITFITISES